MITKKPANSAGFFVFIFYLCNIYNIFIFLIVEYYKMKLLILFSMFNSIIKRINSKYDMLEDFEKSYKELIKLYYLTDDECKRIFIDKFKREINLQTRLKLCRKIN
jgi:hypothetical protein